MDGITGALLEREREMEELTAALARARRGQGAFLVIGGHAGGGKTALLKVALDRARRRRLVVCRARGSELEQDLSFGVIRQLFEPVLLSLPPAERREVMSGAAALAGGVFDRFAVDPAAGTGDGFATLHGLYWLTASLAAARPLVVAVDDAHWADGPSLRALSYLAGRTADLPVVILVTLRPHEQTSVTELVDVLASQPAARRLELSSLSPLAVAMLVRAAHPDASDDLCAAFHEASGGNPFYLQELLRAVGPQTGRAPDVGAVQRAALISVADRVLRRLETLGSGAAELAAAMSVLGAGGRLRHAAAIAQQDLDQAAETALAMRRVEILAGEDPFEWIHPLVQRSIYENLTITQRDRLHSLAAGVLAEAGADPAVVAPHLSARSPAGSTRVVARLLEAAEDALTRNAPDIAVTLLRRALDEQAPDPPRPALLLKLGQVALTRRDPAAAKILDEAHRLAHDPRQRALAAIALGESYTFSGEWDAVARILKEALVEGRDLGGELALELELVYALACAFDPRLTDEFCRDRSRLRELARGESWPARALAAALAMTSACRAEHLEEIVTLCEHATTDDVLLSQRGAGAFASGHVLMALGTIDANDRALDFANRVEDAARAQGSFANAIVSDMSRGWTLLRRGELLQAEELLRPVIDAAAEQGALLLVVNLLYLLPDLIAERPSQQALGTMVESVELPPAFAEAAGGGWILSARGRLRALKGQRAAAEADLRTSGSIFRQLGFGPLPEPWRSHLALALPADARDEATALVEEELRIARATKLPRPQGVVLRAAGLLAERDEAIEMLRESVVLLTDSPARYEHARSLVELGAALRRSGRRSDAREPLREGSELAHRCGAERLLVRAREELLATGARPRRIARSGFDALTASERRVIRLAAEGRSNPEIAQALYLSVKTVERHLSNAYAKIELSGPGARRRLPQLVEEADSASAA